MLALPAWHLDAAFLVSKQVPTPTILSRQPRGEATMLLLARPPRTLLCKNLLCLVRPWTCPVPRWLWSSILWVPRRHLVPPPFETPHHHPTITTTPPFSSFRLWQVLESFGAGMSWRAASLHANKGLMTNAWRMRPLWPGSEGRNKIPLYQPCVRGT